MSLDIPALAIQASSLNTASEVSTAVMKKALGSMEVSGENMVKMMEQSVTPNLGQNIDYRV